MKPALLALAVLVLVAPAEGQRSHAVGTQQLPTYVTQLGKTHFPAGEAALAEWPQSIVALRSGAVLVAGSTGGSIGEPHAGANSDPDIFLARLDPLGNVEWIRQIGAITAPTIPALNGNPAGPGGDATKYDLATDLAVASDGSIYVTGFTTGSLGETKSPRDMFLAKFDAQGSLQWLRQLGKETKTAFVPPLGASPLGKKSDSTGWSVVVDPSGVVYVAGHADGDLGEFNGTDHDEAFLLDVFLARFSSDGELEWLRQMGWHSSQKVGFDPKRQDYCPEIALQPSGTIVMACSSESWTVNFSGGWFTLLTFDSRGIPLACRTLGSGYEYDAHLAIDPRSGRTFIGGITVGSLGEPNGGQSDAVVASFDANLDLEWISQIGWMTAAASNSVVDVTQRDSVHALCADEAGDVILIGETWGKLTEANASGDVFTAKMRGSDGMLVWVSQIGKTTSALHGLFPASAERATAGDLGPGGTIVLTGSTDGDLSEPHGGPGTLHDSDAFVMRLTSRGKL